MLFIGRFFLLLVLRGYELDILGEIADTEDTAVAGIPGQEDGDADTFGNIAVEGEKARRVAGEMDAAAHDIGGQLRRGALQHPADGLHDGRAGTLEGGIGLGRGEGDRSGGSVELVDSADEDGAVLLQREGRGQILLDVFGGLGSDENGAFLAEILDEGLVELVAADLNALGYHETAEEMTATSVVPAPISTTMLPTGS